MVLPTTVSSDREITNARSPTYPILRDRKEREEEHADVHYVKGSLER